MSKFLSRKFVMGLIGIALVILWNIMKWDNASLIYAEGFVVIYTAGNVLSKK